MSAPSRRPTQAPTRAPTVVPTQFPTQAPSISPTEAPVDLLRCGNLLSYVGANRICAPLGASVPAVFDSATIYVSDFRPIAPANMRYGAKRSRVLGLFVTSAESPPTNLTLPSGVFLYTYTILNLASLDVFCFRVSPLHSP